MSKSGVRNKRDALRFIAGEVVAHLRAEGPLLITSDMGDAEAERLEWAIGEVERRLEAMGASRLAAKPLRRNR